LSSILETFEERKGDEVSVPTRLDFLDENTSAHLLECIRDPHSSSYRSHMSYRFDLKGGKRAREEVDGEERELKNENEQM